MQIDFLQNLYGGWDDSEGYIDIGVVREVKIIVDENEYSQESQAGEKYSILKDSKIGARVNYLLDVQTITGAGGILTNVPFLFNSYGRHGAVNGGIPNYGQQVLILYIGEKSQPVALGGLIYRIVDAVAKGKIPILKPGEQIVQSEIPEDPFDEEKRFYFKPGASIYLDYKGRVHLKSVQNDDSINGEVEITLGNPIDDDTVDEDGQFVSTDPHTEGEIVFRIKTSAGVTIAVDKDGNIHSTILKDYIKQCVNEEIALSGNRIETIAGNEEKEVEGHYQLTNSDIRLGGSDVDQRLVLGEVWMQLMNDLLTAINNMTLKHPQGPTLPMPINAAEFNAVQSKLENALSEIAKTKK